MAVKQFESDDQKVAGLYYGRDADDKIIGATIAFDDIQAILQMATQDLKTVEFSGTIFMDSAAQYRMQLDDGIYDEVKKLRTEDDCPEIQKIPCYVSFVKQQSYNVQ